jgi:hypothetical protein
MRGECRETDEEDLELKEKLTNVMEDEEKKEKRDMVIPEVRQRTGERKTKGGRMNTFAKGEKFKAIEERKDDEK